MHSCFGNTDFSFARLRIGACNASKGRVSICYEGSNLLRTGHSFYRHSCDNPFACEGLVLNQRNAEEWCIVDGIHYSCQQIKCEHFT